MTLLKIWTACLRSKMLAERRKARFIDVLLILVLLSSCAYNDIPKVGDCASSNLSLQISSKQNPSSCKAINGHVELTVSGGQGPNSYSLNGSSFQSGSSFSFLGPGSYLAIGKDAHNCQSTLSISLSSPESMLTANVSETPDTECLSNNGSISISGAQGNSPYQYQFGTGAFGNQNIFDNLRSGIYVLTVKDADDCPYVVGTEVPRESTGVSYSLDIVPILMVSCTLSGCHNGDLGNSRDWRNYDNVKFNAQNIKTRTENRTMPVGGNTLTQDQIDLINCWIEDGANNN